MINRNNPNSNSVQHTNSCDSKNAFVQQLAENNWYPKIMSETEYQLARDFYESDLVTAMGERFKCSPEFEAELNGKEAMFPQVAKFIKRVLFDANENTSKNEVDDGGFKAKFSDLEAHWNQSVFTTFTNVLASALSAESSDPDFSMVNLQIEDGKIHALAMLSGITIIKPLGGKKERYRLPGYIMTECVLTNDGFQLDWKNVQPSNQLLRLLLNEREINPLELEAASELAEKEELYRIKNANMRDSFKIPVQNLVEFFNTNQAQLSDTSYEDVSERYKLLALTRLFLQELIINRKNILKEFISFANEVTSPGISTILKTIEPLVNSAQIELTNIVLEEFESSLQNTHDKSLLIQANTFFEQVKGKSPLSSRSIDTIERMTALLGNPLNSRLTKELFKLAKHSEPEEKNLIEGVLKIAKELQFEAAKRALITAHEELKKDDPCVTISKRILNDIDSLNSKSKQIEKDIEDLIPESKLTNSETFKSKYKIDQFDLSTLLTMATQVIQDPNFIIPECDFKKNHKALEIIFNKIKNLQTIRQEQYHTEVNKELQTVIEKPPHKDFWKNWKKIADEAAVQKNYKKTYMSETMKATSTVLEKPTDHNIKTFRNHISNSLQRRVIREELNEGLLNHAAELHYQLTLTSLNDLLATTNPDAEYIKPIIETLKAQVAFLKTCAPDESKVVTYLADWLQDAKTFLQKYGSANKKTSNPPNTKTVNSDYEKFKKLISTVNGKYIQNRIEAMKNKFKIKKLDESKKPPFKRNTQYSAEELKTIESLKLEFIQLLKSIPPEERRKNPDICKFIKEKNTFIDFHRTQYTFFAIGETNTRTIVNDLMSPPEKKLLKTLGRQT